MKIQDAVHALILFDQKKLTPRKTLLRSSNGSSYKFIRVDTQLNWPRMIAEDTDGKEVILNSKEVRLLGLDAEDPGLVIESFIAPLNLCHKRFENSSYTVNLSLCLHLLFWL